MTNDYKEVRFDKHCEFCKHKGKPETDDPCNECLEEFQNLHTTKPTLWEESDK